MENKEQISLESPLVSSGTNFSNVPDTITSDDSFKYDNPHRRLSSSDQDRTARRSRSSSRINISVEAQRAKNAHRSHTIGHSPPQTRNPRRNSSDSLFADLDDYNARNSVIAGNLRRMPSFLNRRRTVTSGNDDVEMSSVARDNLVSEAEFNPYIETEAEEECEQIDDSDTAQLTGQTNIVSDKLKEKAASLIESRYDSDSAYNPRIDSLRHAKSLGRMSQMLARASSRVVNLQNVSRELLERNDMDFELAISLPTSLPTRTSSRKRIENRSSLNKEMGEDRLNSSRYDERASRDKTRLNGKPQNPIILQSGSPLSGKSLFLFGPNDPLRLRLYELLNHPWMESIILCLIVANVALLTAQAWTPLDYGQRKDGWGHSWTDYGLLVIFIIYTLEITARIIVSGFIINPKSQYTLNITNSSSTDSSFAGLPSYLHSQIKGKLSPPINPNLPKISELPTPKFGQLKTTSNAPSSIKNSAFLRHSFNRIDLLAVISFWIDLALALSGVRHFYIFKALATLRSLRLLALTSGSATILQSLKKSAPLLVNTAFFVFFFWNLFSIIAVQAFKGSFLRHCVWIDPEKKQNFTLSDQYCGGHVNGTTGMPSPYLDFNNQPVLDYGKGYICPMGQLCLETKNPYNGTVKFDNIFSSMILVFIISSVQNWSDLMYQTMDSDFDWAALFFLAVVLVLNFWIINLFVAVITEMFAKIREDTAHSAFTLSKTTPILSDNDDGWTLQEGNKMARVNSLTRFMNETKYLWILAIIIDLIIMSFRSSRMNENGIAFLSRAELVFTLIFAVEIILRFGATLLDYRLFFRSKKNSVDFAIAVITCLIQLPNIKSSPAYPYLTVFQIMRVYRVVIAWPRMRNLLMRVLGSAVGLANLIFFIVLVNFITAIIGIQIIRGDIPSVDDDGNEIEMRFSDIFNGFIALYQEKIGPRLSNFVLLNMFIAVVQENFETAEEEKRKQQVKAFLRKAGPKVKQEDIIDSWNVYRFFKAKPKSLAVENIPSSLILSTQKSRVRDFLNEDNIIMQNKKSSRSDHHEDGNGFMARLRRILRQEDEDEHIALADYQYGRRRSEYDDSNGALMTNEPNSGDTMNDRPVEVALDDFQERQAIKADFIAAHPNYDESLWFLSPRNRIRHYCQLLVPPSYGKRLFGTAPSPTLSVLFNIFVFLCIIASVVVAAITNPAYQKTYFAPNNEKRVTWFWITDTAFTGLFTIEFLVKIIADGFLFTPNAYLLNVWNCLDFFVLGTLYFNILSSLLNPNGVSRAVRAFKALRALRLINLSGSIKETFYAILIAGAPRILDAALLTISLIIPFAIYGQNIFSGLLFFCNDDGPLTKNECNDEYMSKPYKNWPVLVPRVWDNPYVWSFDNFRSALLTLFEIVSGEGWINVMTSVMKINGRDQKPQRDVAKWNSLFFIIFNMAGAVFVLTLFISVIIENYQRRSGSAFLTADQKRWIDLKKLLKQSNPSKRPKIRPQNPVRAFCYDQVIQKRGWFSRFMTIVYILHILNLMAEYRNAPEWLDLVRGDAFLLFIAIYIIDICVKLSGFGWKVFRDNRWNLFDLFVVSGAAFTTIPMKFGLVNNQAIVQLQKLFLVAISSKLIQKSDSLNQLFKTMAGSLPSIFNLFAVWFVVFCVYDIMFMETFGLTKYGSTATRHVNFRNFQNSFITLARMSTGEGWNTIMHDYAIEAPFCVDSPSYFHSDCGSKPWAFFLFISWNVISMYIFANMFIVVVIDNFSYSWGAVDIDRTGYIKSQDFAKFFGQLSGCFEVKIYEDVYSVQNIKKNSLKSDVSARTGLWGNTKERDNNGAENIDLQRLGKNIAEINMAKVHERRRIYNYLYQEALLSIERDSKDNEKGISYNNMLIMLAHYKLVDDDKSLEINELLKRKEKLEKVTDNVNRDRVESLLRTIYWHRKFKAYKEQHKMERSSVGTGGVPRITVHHSESPLRIATDSTELNRASSQLTHMSLNQSPITGNSPISSSPISPNSAFETNDFFTNSAHASTDYGRIYEEFDPTSGWRSIDANVEMDDQTADLVLERLQSNIWHDVLQEVTQENLQSNQE
ncbi:hypothetical protein G9A89_017077 [Geosiphon pyriformis]|nr:hypothetical protein G9A89_017077 [Geosiphon pyriformis]